MEETVCCRICPTHDVRCLGYKEGYKFAKCTCCGFIFIPSITREELEAKQQEGPPSGAPQKMGRLLAHGFWHQPLSGSKSVT